jgi:hypothetical protein
MSEEQNTYEAESVELQENEYTFDMLYNDIVGFADHNGYSAQDISDLFQVVVNDLNKHLALHRIALFGLDSQTVE